MGRKKNKLSSEDEQALVVSPSAEVDVVKNSAEKLPAVRRVRMMIASGWQPVPMKEPKIDPEFERMMPIVRAGEVCRYTMAKMLYTISPGGWLFAWWRLCIAGLLALLPVVGVVYLAVLGFSFVLFPVEQAVLTLRQIAVHFIVVAVTAAGIGLTYFVAVTIFKGLALVAKNTLIPTIFAVIILLMAVVAALAWLVSQFPILERVINWFARST